MSPTDYEIDPDGLPPPRRTMRQQLRGRGRWLALGFALALVLAISALMLFSRTDQGRARVLAYTLELLGGRLNGRLTVASVDGNLLTGATLYDVVLTDTAGVALATVDSAYVRYKVATLTGGDIVIGRVDLWGADVYIFRMPGDTLWNYQSILSDPNPPEEPGEPSATLIEQLTLVDSNIKIRLPLEVDSRLPPERQQEELELILSDTTRYMLDMEGDAHMRTTLIDVARADVRQLFIGPDERGGISLQLADAEADVRLWMEPPLHVRSVQGELLLSEGLVRYNAGNVQLASSTGESLGVIDLSGERPLYDIYIESSAFTLSDLRWLYPWLPEDPEAGRGSVRLWVKDRDDGLLVVARDVQLDMPDTQVTGRFGLISNPAADALRFVDVDLEAEPLRLESVEQLLPEDLPVEGLVIGGASIRGES